MAAKKAAKKAPKKAAKKGPKHEGRHDEGKDVRKAYEHLGRLGAMQGLLSTAAMKQIGILSRLAESKLDSGDAKSAAHLLRAGEHSAFGTLATKAKEQGLSELLIQVLNDEYEHLIDKAAEHYAENGESMGADLAGVYDSMQESAAQAYSRGAYRRALEFARGAEALAHVLGDDLQLEDGGAPPKQLKR